MQHVAAPDCLYICGTHPLRDVFVQVSNLGALRLADRPGINLTGVQVVMSKHYLPEYARRCGRTLVFPHANLEQHVDIEAPVDNMMELQQDGTWKTYSLVEENTA